MKRIVILFFAAVTISPAYCQTYLQDGDLCFENGDYTCAISNYDNVFKLAASEKEKKIAELKLSRAKNCAEWIKTADEAFSKKNYKEAKEIYQKVLDSNPKDVRTKTRLDNCNRILNPPETTLSVSKENLSFSSSGGSENITITSNANSYSVNALPSWCTVQKYKEYFIITCTINTSSTARTGYFAVTAGDKTKRININQAGKTSSNISKQEVTLSVSKENLSFYSYGGNSEKINVHSKANAYSISQPPSWCSFQIYNGYFIVSCEANKGQSRSDWFKVIANGEEIKIHIRQQGTATADSQGSSTSTVNDQKSTYSKTKRFNYPKTKDIWGLTLGYVQKEIDSDYYFKYDCLSGIQFGLRVEPLFKYGFGLNTGILLEAYFPSDTKLIWYDNNELKSYALNIPLHLEYRLNFSKWFNMFAYGGAGFNVVTNSSFDDCIFPATLEYGGGFRINHIQLNVGQSLHLGDFQNIRYFGENVRTYQRLAVSVSYMF